MSVSDDVEKIKRQAAKEQKQIAVIKAKWKGSQICKVEYEPYVVEKDGKTYTKYKKVLYALK